MLRMIPKTAYVLPYIAAALKRSRTSALAPLTHVRSSASNGTKQHLHAYEMTDGVRHPKTSDNTVTKQVTIL